MRTNGFNGWRRALAGAAIAAVLAGCGGGGSSSQTLSGKDLLDLKKGQIQSLEGKLTDEQRFRILGIQASNKAEFDKKVAEILAEQTNSQTPPSPAAPPTPASTTSGS